MLTIRGKGYIVSLLILFACTLFCSHSAFAASTISLTTPWAHDIDVIASAGYAISTESINVTTSCRYGYNLTLSTMGDDNNLYLDGDSTNNTEGTYFSPTDGTSVLSATTNKWGFYYNGSTIPTSNSIFLPVPTSDSPTLVKGPLTTPTTSDINDNFNVYYGVSVSPSMPQGSYRMPGDGWTSYSALVYTATIAEDCLRYTVQYNPTSTATGSSVTGTGTMNNQTIYEGTPTQLTTNGYTAPSGYYFSGWNTAQDGTGISYANGQTISTFPPGNNEITLYAQWDPDPSPVACTAGNICYNPNSIYVTGEMGKQTASNNQSVTLWAPNFKRTGYGFAGWNTAYDGSGTTYGPNQDITTPSTTSTNGLALYATWIPSAGTMQNWNGCSSLAQGSVTALTDNRDGNTYAVAKLADNKCWIIENLRLDSEPELTNDNTHNPAVPYVYPNVSNTTLFIDNTASNYNSTGDVYSYGNYYNWSSATAGTGTTTHTISGVTTGDICPAGWHLTIGKKYNEGGEFSTLDVALGGNGVGSNSSTNPTGTVMSTRWRSYPNNFLYSGGGQSTIGLRGTEGFYWSNYSLDNQIAYALLFVVNGVSPADSNNYTTKNSMYTVRCVSGT